MRDYCTPQVLLCSMKLEAKVLYQSCRNVEWDVFYWNRIYNHKYRKQEKFDTSIMSLPASLKCYIEITPKYEMTQLLDLGYHTKFVRTWTTLLIYDDAVTHYPHWQKDHQTILQRRKQVTGKGEKKKKKSPSSRKRYWPPGYIRLLPPLDFSTRHNSLSTIDIQNHQFSARIQSGLLSAVTALLLSQNLLACCGLLAHNSGLLAGSCLQQL